VRLKGYCRSGTFNSNALFEARRAEAHATMARIRDRRRAARSHLSVDFSDSGLITLSPPNALDRMSKIDRHSDFTPSPSARQQRFLTRALGCGVEELVAQLGTQNAIKRVETEVRRAKRARSRKLHAFWSAVKAGIETQSQG
jgi:hypothetical protein